MVKFITTANHEVWLNPRLIYKMEKIGDEYVIIDEHSSNYHLTESEFAWFLLRLRQAGFFVNE